MKNSRILLTAVLAAIAFAAVFSQAAEAKNAEDVSR
jgi:HAMP domain-containing protein